MAAISSSAPFHSWFNQNMVMKGIGRCTSEQQHYPLWLTCREHIFVTNGSRLGQTQRVIFIDSSQQPAMPNKIEFLLVVKINFFLALAMCVCVCVIHRQFPLFRCCTSYLGSTKFCRIKKFGKIYTHWFWSLLSGTEIIWQRTFLVQGKAHVQTVF